MTQPDLGEMDAVETARLTREGRLSARAVTEAALERIAERDPALNAFSVVLRDSALTEADDRDAQRREAPDSGEGLGPLHGVPVAIKEEIAVAGCVTTFGGLGNHTPASADAEVVRRLRAAGAVIVGTTRMPEFGAWPFTESVAYGVTRNPWDTGRTPGGSSGGTAAAVSAGMVPVGMGGDGGGSIRIPAAACGLFGLKPQRGRVSTAPLPDLWGALGTVGPLSRTVRDSALVYDVIRGNVTTDRFRAGPVDSFVAGASREPGRLRVGWTTRPAVAGVRPHRSHVEAVHRTAELLTGLGHDVFEIDPRYPDSRAAFVPQFFAGIRAEADAVEDYSALERRTRQTYRVGSWVSPRVQRWALRRTEAVARRANEVFHRCDVLLTPAVAHRPVDVGVLDGVGPVRASYLAMPSIAYAALWNVAGNPAAAVPAGIATDGLPLSVQLVGKANDEPTLLALAAQIERDRGWPELAPMARPR